MKKKTPIKLTGWKLLWHRYFGLFPIQFCIWCGKWYWSGFPYPSLYQIRHGRFWQWKPCWKDYCSEKCSDYDSYEEGNAELSEWLGMTS